MDNLTPWKEALKERTLYGCFVTYGTSRRSRP